MAEMNTAFIMDCNLYNLQSKIIYFPILHCFFILARKTIFLLLFSSKWRIGKALKEKKNIPMKLTEGKIKMNIVEMQDYISSYIWNKVTYISSFFYQKFFYSCVIFLFGGFYSNSKRFLLYHNLNAL